MVYQIRTVLFFLIFLLTAAVLFAAKEERTINHSFSLNPNGVIQLENVNGDVTIQAWDKNQVDMKAIKRGQAEHLDEVEIEINATPERLSVETKYPRHRKDNNVSVTYELMVPRGARLDSISNVNGDVQVSNVEGQMEIETVNGSADLTGSKEAVQATTVNGNITIKWIDFPDQGDVKAETVNGSLELELPADANADVSASSLNGRVRTDFPITVHGFVSRKLEGKIGTGGTRIDLTTVNGGIEILKSK
jgi:DUF4097 and DUF4098 domain-containing protein YvlB